MTLVRDRRFYYDLFRLSAPVALQALLSVGVNMLDNIMVSSLGDTALSSVVMANQLTVFLDYFIRGIGGASALMIAQYWGGGDMPAIKRLFAVVLRFAFFVMFAVSAVVFIFPGACMRIFVTDEQMIAVGSGYLRIVCLSYIFSTLSQVIASVLRAVEIVRITLYLTLVSLVSNLFFNYALIFGHFGFPAYGVNGAAAATVIARVIEFSFALVYLFRVEKRVSFRFKDLFARDKALFRDFIKFGLPVIIGDMQWGLVGSVKSMAVGRLGPVMVSAHSITETIMSLCFAFTTGMAGGACVTVGKSVGEGDKKKTVLYSRTIQILFAAAGAVLATVLFLIRRIPVAFYTGVSDEVRALAVKFLAVGSVSIAGTAYHASCFTGINRGAGDTRFVFIVDMLCGWLAVVPATFISALVLGAPFTVVYFCTRCDQFFKWIIAAVRLNTGDKWIKNVTRKAEDRIPAADNG